MTAQQRYHAKNRARRNAEGRLYRAAHRPQMHQLYRKRQLALYGLTLADYAKLETVQRGKCAICGRSETTTFRGKPTKLRVDHNHTTGQVRGLLCNDCNVSLGKMHESPERLRKAADYLEQEMKGVMSI